jgi:hypothetical protein
VTTLLRAIAGLWCMLEALCASRRTRAFVAVAVLLVLATGGVHAPMARTELPVAGHPATAKVASTDAGRPERCAERRLEAAVAVRSQPPRVLPRWFDLRTGGLPAPRAPDAA